MNAKVEALDAPTRTAQKDVLRALRIIQREKLLPKTDASAVECERLLREEFPRIAEWDQSGYVRATVEIAFEAREEWFTDWVQS